MNEYQRYQLQWMLDHDISIQDLIQELTLCQKESDDPELTVQEIFDDWEMDCGFGGELWACEDEYNDCEGRCE